MHFEEVVGIERVERSHGLHEAYHCLRQKERQMHEGSDLHRCQLCVR